MIKKKEQEERNNKFYDTNWIFENYNPENPGLYQISIISLANDLGISENDMWGKPGEGIIFFENAQDIMKIAKPFLIKKDVEGWKKYCEGFKEFEKKRKDIK